MACCMFAAFVIGHIVLMWRSIEARWFPQRAMARATMTASAWRPGMEMPSAHSPAWSRPIVKFAGGALIAVSATYFTVQAKDALEHASDAESFAVLLAQNICRVSPQAEAKSVVQIAAAKQIK